MKLNETYWAAIDKHGGIAEFEEGDFIGQDLNFLKRFMRTWGQNWEDYEFVQVKIVKVED